MDDNLYGLDFEVSGCIMGIDVTVKEFDHGFLFLCLW